MEKNIIYNFFSQYKYLVAGLLLLFLILIDWFQGQWEYYISSERLIYLILVKGGVLVTLTLTSIKKNRNLYIVIICLVISSSIGYGQRLIELENLELFIKYLSPFIYFYGFNVLVQTKESYTFLIKISSICIGIALLSILMGMVFNIESLATYSNRFGYKGFFKRSIDASYFIMYAFLFTYFVVKSFHKQLLLYILLLFVSLIIGTKVPFFFIFLFFGFLIYESPQRNKMLSFLFFSFLSSIFLVYTFFLQNIQETYLKFQTIYIEHGIWASLTSYRSILLSDSIDFYKETWEPINYLFGGKNTSRMLIEMSIFDLFVFYGGIGTLLYLFFYFKTYFKNINYSFQVCYIFVVLASILAGQFFFNPSNTIWFATLVLIIQHKNNHFL